MKMSSVALLQGIGIALWVLLSAFAPAAADNGSGNPIPVFYFYGDGCPNCAQEEVFLEDLQQRYPQLDIHSFEVWYHPDNREQLMAIGKAYGVKPVGVPVTFIGEQVWIGFSADLQQEMEQQIQRCREQPCPRPDEYRFTDEIAAPAGTGAISGIEQPLTLPVIGTIDLAEHSLWFTTALIGFIDGFNPCSLWVLSMLLAIVIYSGSRQKIVLIGLTFLSVTATAYGLFIVGLFNVFSYVGYIRWIQITVALLALSFALVNIKDYFRFKQGFSFSIPDRYKPAIFRDIRNIANSTKGMPAILAATATMALGITLVELPCTAGFPVIWSNIVASHEVSGYTFAILLAIYLLIYLADELALFISVAITLKIGKLQENQGRILKLIGGTVMLALAVALLVDPEAMNNLSGSLWVFGAAVLVTLLLMGLHRYRYGSF